MASSSVDINGTNNPLPPEQQEHRHFRFLDLPGEIRHQIYRELLCSEKVHRPVSSSSIARRYAYQVSLLRCNKQIREEASPVLYQDNCFITISLNWYTKPEDLHLRVRLSSSAVHSCYEAIATRRLEPAMEVKLRTDRTNHPVPATKGMSNFFLITPWELHPTLQLLGRSDNTPGSVSKWTCDIRFDLSSKQRKCQGQLIDGFLGLRSWISLPLTISIRGLDLPESSPLSGFASEDSFPHIDDCIAYASMLETRGDGLLFESGEFDQEFQAHRYFWMGMFYFASITTKLHYMREVTVETVRLLDTKRIWMVFATAIYMLNHGPVESGWRIFNDVRDKYPDPPVDVAAKYHYYLGSVLMRHHKELQAIYHLRMALSARPGWSAAEQRVVELKHRMQSDSWMEGRISRAFEVVLSPVCHQPYRIFTDEEWRQESSRSKEGTDLAAKITRVNEFDWLKLWEYGEPAKGHIPSLNYVNTKGLVAMSTLSARRR